MGIKDNKIMMQNMDLQVIAKFYSLRYNLSEKEVLCQLKEFIKVAGKKTENDYQAVYKITEAPVTVGKVASL